jgi:hypothetical protein
MDVLISLTASDSCPASLNERQSIAKPTGFGGLGEGPWSVRLGALPDSGVTNPAAWLRSVYQIDHKLTVLRGSRCRGPPMPLRYCGGLFW